MNRSPDDPDAARGSIEALNRRLIDGIAQPLDLNAGFDIAEILRSLTAGLAQDTERWLEIQNRYYRKRLELWAAYAQSRPGAPAQPVIEPDASDRRFRAPEWRKEPYFDYLTQSYLLTAHWLREVVDVALKTWRDDAASGHAPPFRGDLGPSMTDEPLNPRATERAVTGGAPGGRTPRRGRPRAPAGRARPRRAPRGRSRCRPRGGTPRRRPGAPCGRCGP